MLVVKLVSTTSPRKEYFEFPRVTVASGAWKEVTDGSFNGRAFVITDQEVIDETLCKPNVYIPDVIMSDKKPTDGDIVNVVVGRESNGAPLVTIAIGDGDYEGYVMQDGRTVDRL
jgi:hypothetical protein